MSRVAIRCGWCGAERTLWAGNHRLEPADRCPPELAEELRHADKCWNCKLPYNWFRYTGIYITSLPPELDPYRPMTDPPKDWPSAARRIVENLLRPRR